MLLLLGKLIYQFLVPNSWFVQNWLEILPLLFNVRDDSFSIILGDIFSLVFCYCSDGLIAIPMNVLNALRVPFRTRGLVKSLDSWLIILGLLFYAFLRAEIQISGLQLLIHGPISRHENPMLLRAQRFHILEIWQFIQVNLLLLFMAFWLQIQRLSNKGRVIKRVVLFVIYLITNAA